MDETQIHAQLLDPESKRAIRNALNRMPYAGSLAMGGWARADGLNTVADLVQHLDDLAAVLRDVGTRNTLVEAERDQLRRDQAAVRRVLGTA